MAATALRSFLGIRIYSRVAASAASSKFNTSSLTNVLCGFVVRGVPLFLHKAECCGEALRLSRQILLCLDQTVFSLDGGPAPCMFLSRRAC